MTIFAEIVPFKEAFRLHTASQMPDGDGPVDIQGPTIEDVIAELSKRLGTGEEIVPRGKFPTFDMQGS